MGYKKIISVILSVLIILHPFTLHAEDEEWLSEQIQESDEADPDESETATESAEINTEPENTEEPVEPTSSDSATLDQQTQNTNTADVNNNLEAESSTGDNHTENNIISEIDTGEASISADVITLANNNEVGHDIHQDIVNVTADHTGDIDLSEKPPCRDMSEATTSDFIAIKEDRENIYERIYNSNKAKIINNITLFAVTGDNSSQDIVNTIETGDADITLNVFNMVNTNLVGNCGYFGVINIYGDQTGDIILPDELAYLGFNNDSFSSTSISNENDATIENNIEIDANTGGNTATGYSQIETGTSASTIQLADRANTNIVGDRWALVLVNYYGTWDGEVEGWNGSTQSAPHSVLLWMRIPAEKEPELDTSSDNSIENNNDAVVENNIRLVADTGNNSAEGRLSTIKTGNASVTVNEATVANTNIIGNNWFFAIINIFGNFIGNLVFSRPAGATTKTVDIAPTITPTPKIGGADILETNQNPVSENVLGSYAVRPSTYYQSSANPVTTIEIDSLFANQHTTFDQKAPTTVLSLREYADTSKGSNFCRINIAVCSVVGISTISFVYIYIKRRKLGRFKFTS